jgi:hypothetical protein
MVFNFEEKVLRKIYGPKREESVCNFGYFMTRKFEIYTGPLILFKV